MSVDLYGRFGASIESMRDRVRKIKEENGGKTNENEQSGKLGFDANDKVVTISTAKEKGE